LYFQSWSDPSAFFATYLIVPPIAVEISKYIPPMFAAQFQSIGARAGITVFPYPPIPERVESKALLDHLARARDDDLVFGGTVDTSSPERLLQAASEAGQQYFDGFNAYMDSVPMGVEPESAPREDSGTVSVNEVLYALMSERDRLAELTKLAGQLRYAIEGGDRVLAEDTVAEMKRLAKHLPEKYRAEQAMQAAKRPGPEGDRLAQLYLERAYKLADEDYQAVKELDTQIEQLSGE